MEEPEPEDEDGGRGGACGGICGCCGCGVKNKRQNETQKESFFAFFQSSIVGCCFLRSFFIILSDLKSDRPLSRSRSYNLFLMGVASVLNEAVCKASTSMRCSAPLFFLEWWVTYAISSSSFQSFMWFAELPKGTF